MRQLGLHQRLRRVVTVAIRTKIENTLGWLLEPKAHSRPPYGPSPVVRTATFRSAAIAAGAFAIFVLVLFSFIYWKTDRYLIARSDNVITSQLKVMSALPLERQTDIIAYHLGEDPRGVQFAGLFRPDGTRIAGNLDGLPPDLRLDVSCRARR